MYIQTFSIPQQTWFNARIDISMSNVSECFLFLITNALRFFCSQRRYPQNLVQVILNEKRHRAAHQRNEYPIASKETRSHFVRPQATRIHKAKLRRKPPCYYPELIFKECQLISTCDPVLYDSTVQSSSNQKLVGEKVFASNGCCKTRSPSSPTGKKETRVLSPRFLHVADT